MRKWIVNIFTIIFVFASVFISSNKFVDVSVLPKWYVFFIIGSMGAMFVAVFIKNFRFRINILDVLFSVFIIYILLRSLTFPVNLRFWAITSCTLIYFVCKVVDTKHKDFIELVFVCTSITQSLYGLLQYIEIEIHNTGYYILGSYDNPAGYAACIVISLPFCLSSSIIPNSLKYVAIFILMLGVIVSGSRASIVAFMIIMFIFCCSHYKLYLRKRKMFCISIVLMTVIFLCLLYLKIDSATGRILIWQNSIQMALENFLLGYGSGKFKVEYMNYQADFFKNNRDTCFDQLADNVSHPFNEFLLLIIEYGLISFILLSVMLYIVFKNNRITNPCLLSLFAIMIISLFSYPFRYSYIVLLAVWNFVYLARCEKIDFICIINMNIVIRILVFLVSILVLYFTVKNIYFESAWKKLTKQVSLGKAKKIIGDYDCLYHDWNGNPLFLYNYAAILYKIGRYNESLKVLLFCEKYYNDYEVQMLIAGNYYLIKRMNLAEEKYIKASNMCPNRFLPLYKLVSVYDKMNREKDASNMIDRILNKKVKIPSITIDSIKMKMHRRMNQ